MPFDFAPAHLLERRPPRTPATFDDFGQLWRGLIAAVADPDDPDTRWVVNECFIAICNAVGDGLPLGPLLDRIDAVLQ